MDIGEVTALLRQRNGNRIIVLEMRGHANKLFMRILDGTGNPGYVICYSH